MALARGQVTTLLASAVQAASGNQVFSWASPDKATFILNVTASSSPTTMDVYIQTSPDSGTTWYDVVHFTQVGAVATNIQAAQWCRIASAANNDTSVIVTGDAALAAAKVINGPVVDSRMRVKFVIVGTSYTFSVMAITDRDV